MKRHLGFGRAAAALGLLSSLVAGTVIAPAASAGAVAYPNSIASTGDSITRGYNTGSAFADNPASSWSTGTTASVNSHYLRIRTANPAVDGHVFNDATTGAVMADLDAQLATVAGQHVDYVTILMGANDACKPTVAQMTSVATFRSQFATALQHFATASPHTKILVASVPNLMTLWSLFKNNGSARFIWSIGKICQSILANPTSTTTADVARRQQVQQRVTDYNVQLQQVCALYPSTCRFDGNAVYNTVFVPSDVNTRDYFHPSTSGQAKLAAVTFSAGFWGP